MVPVAAPATSTASVATRAAAWALREISRMLLDISSTPVATVSTLRLTCSAAADTTVAWVEVSSALAAICWLTDDICSDAPLSEVEFSAIVLIASLIRPRAWLSARLVCPISSAFLIAIRCERSPSATRLAIATTSPSGRTIDRMTAYESAPRMATLARSTRKMRFLACLWLD